MPSSPLKLKLISYSSVLPPLLILNQYLLSACQVPTILWSQKGKPSMPGSVPYGGYTPVGKILVLKIKLKSINELLLCIICNIRKK